MRWMHRSVPRLRYQMVKLAFALWWCQSSSLLLAGELIELNVTHEKGAYAISLEMTIYAPAAEVRSVLTDFKHIYRLNPSIIESEILSGPAEGVTRVRTLVSDCVSIFCIEIERVEDVRTLDTGDLEARTVAELSDLEAGISLWRIIPEQNHSRVLFQGSIKPGFFVVPIIGSYFVKKKLHEQMLVSIENVERIARIHAGMDVGPPPGSAILVAECGRLTRNC